MVPETGYVAPAELLRSAALSGSGIVLVVALLVHSASGSVSLPLLHLVVSLVHSLTRSCCGSHGCHHHGCTPEDCDHQTKVPEYFHGVFLLRQPASKPACLHTPPPQAGIYSDHAPGQIISADREILNRLVNIIIAAVSSKQERLHEGRIPGFAGNLCSSGKKW
jgi:hypothetical protein